MSEPIRVLVADDHPLFREGVVHSLAAEPDMNIVAQAASGEEALRLPRGPPPAGGRPGVVRATPHGEVYVSPSLAAAMLMALTRGRPADPLEELTERELEILKLGGQGLTNRQT